jgi:hypothetical protein
MLRWCYRIGLGSLLLFTAGIAFALLLGHPRLQYNYFVDSVLFFWSHWALVGLGLLAINVCNAVITRATTDFPQMEMLEYRKARFTLYALLLWPFVLARLMFETAETYGYSWVMWQNSATGYSTPPGTHEQLQSALGTGIDGAAGLFCSLLWSCAMLAVQPRTPQLSWIYQLVFYPAWVASNVLLSINANQLETLEALWESDLLGWLMGAVLMSLLVLCLALGRLSAGRLAYILVCVLMVLGLLVYALPFNGFLGAHVVWIGSGILSGFFSQSGLVDTLVLWLNSLSYPSWMSESGAAPMVLLALVPISVAALLFFFVRNVLLNERIQPAENGAALLLN